MRVFKSKPPAVAASIAAVTMLAFTPLSAGSAAAANYKVGSLQITRTWARATPKGADTGAAYMTVTNTGKTVERLSCVSSDASAGCQIHQMMDDNGVMKMRPVPGGLPIKPGQTVTLDPGGYHLMLVNLKKPLQQGRSVEVTLKTNDGATALVEFPIAAIGAPAPGIAGGGGTMTMQGPGMSHQGGGMNMGSGGAMK